MKIKQWENYKKNQHFDHYRKQSSIENGRNFEVFMKQEDESEERPPVCMYASDTGTFLHCWICVPYLISITKHHTQIASNTAPCILV